MNIVFFFNQFAGYFYESMRYLTEHYDVNVKVIAFRANAVAPFQFAEHPKIHIHYREDLTRQQLKEFVEEAQPSVLYLAGWRDRKDLALARRWRKTIPVIMGLDNHWKGSLRQRLGCLLAPWFLHRAVSHVWIAGLYQYEFARRLGFKNKQILYGLYCAATQSFQRPNRTSYPPILLFVGRLVSYKGVLDLADAFCELAEQGETDWQLMIVGNGPLRAQLPTHSQLLIRDFVQPEQLSDLMSQVGAFCLPSHKEPWGVVIHEAAAAALPLITSTVCGASTAFLVDGYNGYHFQPANKIALKAALRRIIGKNAEDLQKLGQRSYELSRQLTPERWALTLLSVVRQGIK